MLNTDSDATIESKITKISLAMNPKIYISMKPFSSSPKHQIVAQLPTSSVVLQDKHLNPIFFWQAFSCLHTYQIIP